MHVFTVASQKGGVGKTTVTLNLAYTLAKRGWNTLVVDADPLGAIGLSLSKKMTQAVGLYDVLSGQVSVGQAIVRTRVPDLSILPVGQVPATDGMRFHEYLETGEALRELLQETNFDVVVIDTPSGFVGSTIGAMRASDHVLCPVQSEPVAARAMLRTFDILADLRKKGARVELLGFLLTMVHAQAGTSQAIAHDLKKNLPEGMVLDVMIPREAIFLEASGAGVPLGLLQRRPPVEARVFDRLVEEVELRAGLQAQVEDDREPVRLVD